MLPLTQLPETDPLELYRWRDGLYAVDLLTAALTELDLFTRLGQRPMSLEQLCSELDLQSRPAEVMTTLFVAMGLIERRGGAFQLTGLAREHLVAGAPWCLAPYYASLKSRPVAQDYLSVLRTGRTANWASSKSEKAWARAMEDDAFARQFTAAMDCRGVYLGAALGQTLDLSGCPRLLDVAGGSGIYACSFAARFPALEAIVLEKPPVDAIARRAIAERGLSDRVRVQSGDMFNEPWPADCQAHLISNVLHDWDVPEVRRLLARSAEALPPGGTLILHDMHLNRDKSGPLPVAMYSALLMHSTEGRIYSVAEMEEWLGDAGFDFVDWRETAADRSRIVARKRS